MAQGGSDMFCWLPRQRRNTRSPRVASCFWCVALCRGGCISSPRPSSYLRINLAPNGATYSNARVQFPSPTVPIHGDDFYLRTKTNHRTYRPDQLEHRSLVFQQIQLLDAGQCPGCRGKRMCDESPLDPLLREVVGKLAQQQPKKHSPAAGVTGHAFARDGDLAEIVQTIGHGCTTHSSLIAAPFSLQLCRDTLLL